MLILWVILFSVLGSVGNILAAAIFLLIPEKTQRDLVPSLISYAMGTLLATSFLVLIPQALEQLSPLPVLSTVLLGILLFFFLEKIIVWRHCHDPECDVHGASGTMLLIGDGFHNLTDGIIIAASFLSSIPLGIVTSLSVIVHEIPQEVGDFAILLHSGYSRRRAFLLNVVSSLSSVPGAILSYYALGVMHSAIPYIMSISAASFLYIALANLSPELHRKLGVKHGITQFLLMIAGVGTIILLLQLNH